MTAADTPRQVESFFQVLEGAHYAVTLDGEDEPWDLGLVREIHVVSDQYIVYTSENWKVCSTSTYFVEGQNEFLAALQRVQSLPTAILSDEERAQFRAILGYALAASLEQEAKVAAAGLEDARLFLETQAEKRARLNYLLGATGGAALAVALGAIGLSAWPHDAPAEPTVFHLACIALIGGALGGMLSIGRRQRGPTRFDPLASAEACRISGALRVLYAAISGFLVYAAIHVGLVTSAFVENLSSSAEQIAAGILISAAGGYLENWTTSILGLVGGNQDRGSQNAGADAQPGEDSA